MRAVGSWRVVVVGAGTMGHGIAQVAAMAALRVTLCDLRDDLVENGLRRIRENLEKGVRRGKVTDHQRQAALARLEGSTSPQAAFPRADLVVEAVPEEPDLKRKVLAGIAAGVAPGAVIATNTSSLPLSLLSSVLPRPERFIGLHFFNPPHLMPLVEIVVGKKTSRETRRHAQALVECLGKEAIVVKDSPGFATSRLGLAIGLEAMRMLEEGVASAADIDRAMELGYRHPMGPLKLSDLVGLDVRLGISKTLARELHPVRFAPPEILVEKVKEGKLGKKTGEGFYRWSGSGNEPVE
ncbi:MAG: 3-hydroxyacyl-CoA dehydrogenase family protein [Acidobacteriota bacterium]